MAMERVYFTDALKINTGDKILVKYFYDGGVYEIQGHAQRVVPHPDLPVPAPHDIKVGHLFVTVGGKVPAEIESITMVRRAAIPEPPEGSIVECDGCGARHFRATRKDGYGADPAYCWLSQDTGTFHTWDDLQNMKDNCGQRKVVYTP